MPSPISHHQYRITNIGRNSVITNIGNVKYNILIGGGPISPWPQLWSICMKRKHHLDVKKCNQGDAYIIPFAISYRFKTCFNSIEINYYILPIIIYSPNPTKSGIAVFECLFPFVTLHLTNARNINTGIKICLF